MLWRRVLRGSCRVHLCIQRFFGHQVALTCVMIFDHRCTNFLQRLYLLRFPLYLLPNWFFTWLFYPIWQRVTATQRQVNIADRMWARLLSSTNQPNFLRYNKYMQQLRKQNALKQALESEQHVTVANSNSVPSSPSSSTVSTHQLFPQSFFQHEDKWSKT